MKTDAKTWLLVFQHNVKVGYFKSLDDAKYSQESGRFSILANITDNMKIDNKFEFRLEYPQNGSVYHWQQTENPIKISEGSLSSEKYSPLLISNNDQSWRGYLALSTRSQCTLLDGFELSEHWWYSIGAMDCVSDYYKANPKTIPGPHNVPVTEVSLWLRIPNLQCQSTAANYRHLLMFMFALE